VVRHRLSDDEWDLISDLFPPPSNIGRPRNNPRDMMDGILWILRTGAPWRDIPAEIGNWSSVWDAFDRWNSDGTLSRILSRLMASHVDVGLIDQELWLVDGTVVRAARCAAGGGKESDPDEPDDHALGRSRGGFSTKVHLLCDRHGHRSRRGSHLAKNTNRDRSANCSTPLTSPTMTVRQYRYPRTSRATRRTAPNGLTSFCSTRASRP